MSNKMKPAGLGASITTFAKGYGMGVAIKGANNNIGVAIKGATVPTMSQPATNQGTFAPKNKAVGSFTPKAPQHKAHHAPTKNDAAVAAINSLTKNAPPGLAMKKGALEKFEQEFKEQQLRQKTSQDPNAPKIIID